MYKFHHKYIGKKYYDKSKLFYEIKTEDAYENFYENTSLFDFSDYSED